MNVANTNMRSVSSPPKAVIINLTRFGDLIQSQPVLSRLKAMGFATHLVCLENFASAARLLQHADHIHPFPGARFLALLDSSWTGAVRELQDWVNSTINGRNFDMAVNLTPSLSSRLLTRQYQAQEQRGFFLDEEGFGCYSGIWAAFLQASSAHRGCSPFNIVDMFVRAAHFRVESSGPLIHIPSRERISDMLELLNREWNEKVFSGFVAFQPGASDDKRRWPVEYFARLGDMLYRQLNLCPVLLGSRGERKLAEKYGALSRGPHINLTGKTNLEDLSAVLSTCRLLVTNDTGTMHLAAGLGVKSLAFFLATAQPWDTGPYLKNCLCMEPGVECHPCSFSHQCQTGFSCRKVITPELVYQAVEGFIAKQSWPRIETGQAKIRMTTFMDGFHSLIPMNMSAMDNYSQWMLIQKHYYNLFLEEKDILPPRGLTKPDNSYSENIVDHISRITPLLKLAGEQANVLKKVALPSVKTKFLSTWQRLSQELTQSPYLPVLGLLWTYQTQAASIDLEKINMLCAGYLMLLQSISDFLKSP